MVQAGRWGSAPFICTSRQRLETEADYLLLPRPVAPAAQIPNGTRLKGVEHTIVHNA